jgi:uncharacterized protein (TIGR03437 family)
MAIAIQRRMLLAAVMFLASSVTRGQNTITTFAGADWQFPADGKRAVDAPLGGALGLSVAVDSQGNYYIADQDNALVMKVGTDGILHVIGGNGIIGYSGDGGPATEAALTTLRGIAVDLNGNIYLAEYARVRKIDPSGIISTVAGASNDSGYAGDGGPALDAKFNYIFAIAADAKGNIYVADQNNHRIRKIVPGGNVTTIAGNGNVDQPVDGDALGTSINSPLGIAVDSKGNVYFTDETPVVPQIGFGLGLVRRVTPGGQLETVVGGVASFVNFGLVIGPTAIATDLSDNIYFGEYLRSSVYKIAADLSAITLVAGLGQSGSSTGFSGDGGPATRARLNLTYGGLAVDSNGNLYIADNFNTRVREVTADGNINTVAGNGQFRSATGLPATSASLYLPASIAFDPAGNLYIAEPFVNRIRKVTTGGALSTFAGTSLPAFSGDQGPATSAGFFWPFGVAADRSGNVYIADSFNNRVRKVTPAGIVTTVAGGASTTAVGDGGPATSAYLSSPQGVAVDSGGAIYIADNGANRIRKVDSYGAITTIAGTGQAGFSGDNGPAVQASINGPTAIKVDAAGNVYFSDSGNNRIRRIAATSGTITTIAGTGVAGFTGDGSPAVRATLNNPRGLAIDAAGNLYVADTGNNVVRRIDPTGITLGNIQTIAGTGTAILSGDGGPAAAANLFQPYDVALDNAGNLYIADTFNDRIRVVLVNPPRLQIFPTALSYATPLNGDVTPTKNLYVTGSVSGLPFTVSGNRNWLVISSTAAVTPATIQVSVDPSNIGDDLSAGTITVSAPSTVTGQQQASIGLSITTALPGGLTIVSDALSFALFQGGQPSTQTITLSNDSGSDAAFSVATDPAFAWLTVTPSAGVLGARAQISLTVTADPAKLAIGTYTGQILITDTRNGDTDGLAVTATVSAVPQSIFLTQSGLTFTAVANGGVSAPQTVGVVNLGRGSMNWTAAASDLAGKSVNWLSVDPNSGASDAASRNVPQFTVSVNHVGLAPGNYYGQIQVTAPGADNSPQFVLIVLTVLPAGTNPGPVVQPTSLIFNATAGGVSPSSQTVTVSNLYTQATSFASGRVTESGKPWFTYIPAAGTIAPGQFTRFVVQPLVEGLSPGVYRGSLTMLFDGNVARTVSLVFIVAGSGSSPQGKGGRGAGTCGPSKLVPIFTSIGSETAVPAGWPQRLVVRVLDDCGTPMTAGAVNAQFSGNIPPLSLTSLNDGNWSGTWQSRNNPSSTVTIKVKAEIPGQQLAGTAEITGTVTPNQDPPVLNSGAVVSAASLIPQKPLAPGSLISITGGKLAAASSTANNFPLPTQLAGTLVAIAGKALPLVEVADDHINAVVPFDVPVNTRVQLIVQRGNSAAVPENITIAAVQPAIFTTGNSGSGQGQIFKVNGDGSVTLAGPGSAATAGDNILVQCTGLGAVDPPVPAGTAASDSPLSQVTQHVSLTIGGVPADVQIAALQPGLSGFYVISATVPAGAPTGDAVPVVVSLGNQSSPAVTMAVR